MVEAGLVEGDHEVHVGPRLGGEPREDHQVPTVAAVDHRRIVVVSQDGHRSRACLDAAHRGQEQRRQLRVTQRIGAHGETVVVVEQAERRLLAGAQEVRLVGHPAQAGHDVGPALPHLGHDVEQPRATLPQHLGALDRDLAPRRDPAQPQPRLDQRAQRLVASGRHSWTGLSSGARSNHKNP